MNELPRIWITWENQRRSIELSRYLNCEFYLFKYSGALRYIKCIVNTINVLLKNRNSVIFVQNPSMVLATIACIYKLISNSIIIVDRHTTFVMDNLKKNRFKYILFTVMHAFTIRYADITIVTNKYLAEIVRSMNGNAFVLPDKLPDMAYTEYYKVEGKYNILLISSFGDDEPICEVLKAMEMISDTDTVLYISGNSNKLPKEIINSAPSNVIFTGFLAENEFNNLLYSVDAVMVLTTADNCMMCGCYEAVAACKPIITSNKVVLREYFKGSVFVDNTGEDIKKGIQDLRSNHVNYKNNVIKLKKSLVKSWKDQIDILENSITKHNTINYVKSKFNL